MKTYRAKRTYADGTKHLVYYVHMEKDIPNSFGWDMNEISDIVKEGRNLSFSIKI